MKFIYYIFSMCLIVGHSVFASENESCILNGQAIEVEANNWTELYSIAICYAKSGDKFNSSEFLIKAVNKGFADIEMITKNANLKILKNTPEWDDFFLQPLNWVDEIFEKHHCSKFLYINAVIHGLTITSNIIAVCWTFFKSPLFCYSNINKLLDNRFNQIYL